MDLTRQPPRSPKSTDVLNCVAVARMADKGRAHLAGTIGEYKYGGDSGLDKSILGFLGLTPDAFTEGLKAAQDDASLSAWLKDRVKKTDAEIEAFNAQRLGPPATPEMKALFEQRKATLAPDRDDLTTLWDLTELDDKQSFGLA